MSPELQPVGLDSRLYRFGPFRFSAHATLSFSATCPRFPGEDPGPDRTCRGCCPRHSSVALAESEDGGVPGVSLLVARSGGSGSR